MTLGYATVYKSTHKIRLIIITKVRPALLLSAWAVIITKWMNNTVIHVPSID